MLQAFPRLRSLCSCAGVLAGIIAFCSATLLAQSFSPAGPVNLGNIDVRSASNTTITFTAPAPVTIASISTLTDGVTAQDFYVLQQNCVGTVTTCTIEIGFTPGFAGKRNGFLGLLDGNNNLIARAYLYGIGIFGQVSFTPSGIFPALTVAPVTPANFSPTSATPDGAGNLYLNDIANSRLLKLSNTGVFSNVTSLTGSARSSLAIDGSGTIYASSPTQGVVYAIPSGGVAAPFSTGTVALVTPTGVATDGLGNLYIADAGTNHIVRSALDGSGSAVVTLPGITLSSPAGLVIDSSGNLYIVDSGNDRVLLYNPGANTASVVPITGLTLNNPAGISVDAAGTLYIADTGNQRITVVPPGAAAYALPLNGTALATPTGVAIFTAANIVISDSTLGLVTVARSSLTVNFPTATHVGAVDTTDGYKTFGIQNTGNITLGYVKPTSGNNPAISNANFTDVGGTFTCPNVTPTSASAQLALGASCTYAVEFTPVANGTDTATFTMYFADTGTSGVTVAPFATLTGTGTSSLAKFTITATPSSVLIGAPVSFTVTAINASGQTATDYLGTVTFTSTDTTATFLGGTTYTFTAADAGTHTFSDAAAIDFHQLGTFTITVADGSTNAVSNNVLVQAQSATALTAVPNPVAVGGSTTLTATVTSATAGITRVPTGTVTFSSVPSPGTTAVVLGTATLNSSGVATFNATFTTSGDPCITAAYSGDTAFIVSTSAAVCVAVGDFSLALDKSSAANQTVVYGNPVSYLFDVTPVGATAFVNNINFTVTGLPASAPYTITPGTINAGTGASTVKLTITPVKPNAKITPIVIALLALPFVWWRRRKLSSVLAAAVLMALLVFPLGCSSGSGYFNPAFTLYSITFTGTSGTAAHSVTVSLTGE